MPLRGMDEEPGGILLVNPARVMFLPLSAKIGIF